jgi:hypothetical protein
MGGVLETYDGTAHPITPLKWGLLFFVRIRSQWTIKWQPFGAFGQKRSPLVEKPESTSDSEISRQLTQISGCSAKA